MMPLVLTTSTAWIVASVLFGLAVLLLHRNYESVPYQLIEMARWTVFPYLALLSGHLSPRLMGLTGNSWQTTFRIGLALCFGLLALVAIVRVTNSRLDSSTAEGATQPSYDLSRDYNERLDAITHDPNWWLWTAICAFSYEFHWAFLRAGVWEAILQTESVLDVPTYTAIWSAGAIAFFEIVVARRGKTQWIWQLTTLLLTSILFFYTQNFYLCGLLHFGITLIMPSSIERPRHIQPSAQLRIETLPQSSQQISEPKR